MSVATKMPSFAENGHKLQHDKANTYSMEVRRAPPPARSTNPQRRPRETPLEPRAGAARLCDGRRGRGGGGGGGGERRPCAGFILRRHREKLRRAVAEIAD